ncbi:MAG: aspartyl-phosphate phosphatase Spo0E family protein [Acidaminobacteraceae bacterium]
MSEKSFRTANVYLGCDEVLPLKKCWLSLVIKWERRKLHKLISTYQLWDDIVVKQSTKIDCLVLLHYEID